jgi:site-specific recombinase XerD
MPIKTDKGWHVDFRPRGRNSKRFRKTFPTKAEALRFKNNILSTYTEEWNETRKDIRKLPELIELWYSHFGVALKAGKQRKKVLVRLSQFLFNPVAASLDTTLYVAYRSERLNKDISGHTLNRELAYLKALYNDLIRSGHFKGNNPVSKIKLLKVQETEMAYLTDENIKELTIQLENSSNSSVKIVALICLSTGCRWSEAEGLTSNNILNGKVIFTDTKSGKNRAIPISSELENTLPKIQGLLFDSCYAAFRQAIKRCNFQLPPGQSSHVLRHTFASHFMIKGGNILVLQRILGHSSLVMTMRYSHFSPDHLEDAVKYNPLANL